MKNYSIWKDNFKLKKYPKLDKNIKTNILVIGGGITGASCFYYLKNSNLNVVLVEQGKIGISTTSNSTGKLTFMQNDLIDKIRNNYSDDVAKKYINSQIDAINKVCDIVKKESINCDLKKVSSIIYTNKDNEINKVKRLKEFFVNCGINVYETSNKIVDSKYMIACDNTYYFHPLKFVYGLIKDFDNIYEDTSIKKIKYINDYYHCYTDKYVIEAKKIVIASHYPYFNIPYFFPIKGTCEKSYLCASKKKIDNISLISYSYPFVSIRNYKDYLIYLSNSHAISKDNDDKENFNELIKKVHDLKLEPEYLWSNIDIMTNDGIPYIGKIKDNMFIATGYNTWGLANSVLAGSIINDIILNKENKYIDLFNPKRCNPSMVLGSFNALSKSIGGYISSIKNSAGKTCPHMGCKLLYNEIENTYDCPCHGSRFKNNKPIMAPANKEII